MEPREVDRMVRARESQTRNAFARSDFRAWEFEKVLGNGAFGLSVLLKDRDPLHIRGRKRKRVVLKRALVPERGVDDFRREMQVLWDLRGHSHISHMLDATGAVEMFRPRAGRTASFLRRILVAVTNPPENIFKALSQHFGPAIILDYLENGTMRDLIIKQRSWGIQFPNRVLWSFYHCLVRACVGMTQRKEAPPEQPLELETPLREGQDQDHYLLAHHDIAARNIMIGDLEPRVPEHRLVNKLVLIDFGLADYTHAPRMAEVYNLTMVAREVIYLIHPAARMNEGFRECEGIPTEAWELYPMNGINYFPRLDPELRRLLAESLSEVPARPSVRETFRRTQLGVRKPAYAYANAESESDQAIQELLQHMLYDADNDEIDEDEMF
ncbi:hypothetical protein F5Y12DRAFT_711438 [Xylaria sp. FL1777]|nr:hypothetical protein F5Y12DRAFT_711438 [Xylaria sp. FL1777]